MLLKFWLFIWWNNLSQKGKICRRYNCTHEQKQRVCCKYNQCGDCQHRRTGCAHHQGQHHWQYWHQYIHFRNLSAATHWADNPAARCTQRWRQVLGLEFYGQPFALPQSPYSLFQSNVAKYILRNSIDLYFFISIFTITLRLLKWFNLIKNSS